MMLEFSHNPLRFVCLQTALIPSSFDFTSLLVSSYNNLNVISTLKLFCVMFVHFTMGDIDFLNNSSENVVPFCSYCSHYFVFPIYSDHASQKTYFISLHVE